MKGKENPYIEANYYNSWMKFLLEGKTNSCETIDWLDNNKHDQCEIKLLWLGLLPLMSNK